MESGAGDGGEEPVTPGAADGGSAPDWLADLTSASGGVELSGGFDVDGLVGGEFEEAFAPFEELLTASPGDDLPMTAAPGSAAAPSPAPPANAAPPAFVHHTIYDQRSEEPQETPLKLGRAYMLALDVDIQKRQESALKLESAAFQPGEQEIELSVLLTSRDFTIYTGQAQNLRLPLGKPSLNKARFDFQALHAGVGELRAYFFKENNFVQGMSLLVNVEEGQGAVTQVTNLGRSLEGSAALGERDVSLVITNRDAASFDLLLVGPVAGAAYLAPDPARVGEQDQCRASGTAANRLPVGGQRRYPCLPA